MPVAGAPPELGRNAGEDGADFIGWTDVAAMIRKQIAASEGKL